MHSQQSKKLVLNKSSSKLSNLYSKFSIQKSFNKSPSQSLMSSGSKYKPSFLKSHSKRNIIDRSKQENSNLQNRSSQFKYQKSSDKIHLIKQGLKLSVDQKERLVKGVSYDSQSHLFKSKLQEKSNSPNKIFKSYKHLPQIKANRPKHESFSNADDYLKNHQKFLGRLKSIKNSL